MERALTVEASRAAQQVSGRPEGAVAMNPPALPPWHLPRVQKLARALAIIGTCACGGPVGTCLPAAALYVVDAESAYRFCPVQRAD
eukprot:4069053-Pleurochrysis_carterae.AAC.1